MLAVGVTPEWSAKDLLAHLAYWERVAAEQVRALNAGTWSPKKRTREKSCGSIGKLQRRTGATRAVFFARNSTSKKLKSFGATSGTGRDGGVLPTCEDRQFASVRHRGHHLAQLCGWVERLQGFCERTLRKASDGWANPTKLVGCDSGNTLRNAESIMPEPPVSCVRHSCG